jgi:phospholipase/carboxylesterase
MSAAKTVELETGAAPSASIIWLHGLGADGHDFEPIVPELQLPAEMSLRFVFPHAPVRPVTINGGMAMRAWFDILSLERGGPADEAGIRDSAGILDRLIDREIERGIAADRVVVAGFSQGGAIALFTALRRPQRLAGLMALSTYLPLSDAFFDEHREKPGYGNRDLPVFMAHGTFDPVVPMQMGQRAAMQLEGAGFEVEWHDYPMAHAVCAEEIRDIRQWLLAVLAE